ncbi:uncharacterized protein GGS25DRAFT_273923 [Hypoxylon fragiforme]|uniref:uncharacterized protein n=1 Tax=Hypoxylon fragiforme TaxID=63214 RepID=UPI0020C69063|nr:uncharacterized protein GGS25DRAFT_273923 [Hypoxylon fragiforme]KAI2608396.1 hypothetical protein GGS25DRAFT_273923 [Hypoxylon fragiforme]
MPAMRLAMAVRSGAGAANRGQLIFPCRPTGTPHPPKPSSHITNLKFSTSRFGLAATNPSTNKKSPKSPNQPEDPPPLSFSFDGLGMSRNTKLAVITILSIFGTIESFFWAKWIWRWFAGPSKDEPENSS